jgi:hypothetical protein
MIPEEEIYNGICTAIRDALEARAVVLLVVPRKESLALAKIGTLIPANSAEDCQAKLINILEKTLEQVKTGKAIVKTRAEARPARPSHN